MTPKAGDIWRWHYSPLTHIKPRTVLLLKDVTDDSRHTEPTFIGLDFGDNEIEEWYFSESDMKNWEYLA